MFNNTEKLYFFLLINMYFLNLVEAAQKDVTGQLRDTVPAGLLLQH